MSTPAKSDKPVFVKTRYLFFWLVAFYIVFSFLYVFIYSIAEPLQVAFPNLEDPLVNQILYSCSFISICIYARQELRRSKLKPKYLLGDLRPTHPWLALFGMAVIFLVFSLGAALLSFQVLSLVAPQFHESFMKNLSEQEAQVSVFPIINKGWQIINYVAIAPITEEFIFRGVILHRLASKWNLTLAIWISSIIFGLLHPNPVGISVLGVAWALLYLKTKTLIVPIVAHSMNNAMAVGGEYISQAIENNSNVAESATNSNNQWIAGFLLIMLSLPFVVRFIYRRFPSQNKSLPYFVNQAWSEE